MFKRPFGKAGATPPISKTYLTPYRMGDYVDIVANSMQQKGMPHKFYHGRTGIVFNVTHRAIGVEVNKQVRNRIMKKRIHVRVEHVRQSKCRLGFLKRVKQNEHLKREARAAGKPVAIEFIKRMPEAPKPGRFVKVTSSEGKNPILITPQPFDEMI